MISSIFGKTKPVIYLILLGFLFCFYWLAHLVFFERSYPLPELVYRLGIAAVLLFSVFVVNFIVSRNQITGSNSFAMLYFVLLFLVFPETLVDQNAIFCSFFLLLASRRFISMRSERDMRAKIFDAALWIGVASLFYDWALAYLLLVYIAIYFYDPQNLRNWFLPLAGIAAVALVTVAVMMTREDLGFFGRHYDFSLAIYHSFKAMWQHHTKLMAYAALVVVTGFATFLKLGALGMGRIITMRILAISVTLALLIAFVETDENHFPVLISFFPAATFFAKYVEVMRRQNLREITLLASILLPFTYMLIQLL